MTNSVMILLLLQIVSYKGLSGEPVHAWTYAGEYRNLASCEAAAKSFKEDGIKGFSCRPKNIQPTK